MAIEEKDVRKIAKLARIGLSDAEVTHYKNELEGFVKWFDQLSEVDTKGVPEMAGHSGITLPWREDKVTDGNIQQDVVKNAPLSEYGCFLVPKVIE